MREEIFEKLGQILILGTAVSVAQSMSQQQAEVQLGRSVQRPFQSRAIAAWGGITSCGRSALVTSCAPGYGTVLRQQPSPAGVRKDFSFSQRDTLLLIQPAPRLPLQEAESKVNWEQQKQMYVQFASLPGFAKLWDGETLCCTASI